MYYLKTIKILRRKKNLSEATQDWRFVLKLHELGDVYRDHMTLGDVSKDSNRLEDLFRGHNRLAD
jgi:hypothetical protein